MIMKMQMMLTHMLKALDLTAKEARGLLPLAELVKMSNEALEEEREEWCGKHKG